MALVATNRAQAVREINRLRGLLGQSTNWTDPGPSVMTLAALNRTIEKLTATPKPATTVKTGLAVPTAPTKLSPITPQAPAPKVSLTTPNVGAVTPPHPAYPPVTGPTANQAAQVMTATAKQPSRASLLNQINTLRQKLGQPTLATTTMTIAQMQREIVKLDAAVKNPAPPGAPIGGDKTKAQLAKEISAITTQLGLGSANIDVNAMNRTQLANTLAALQQQAGATPTGFGTGAAGDGAADAIFGIPRKTFLLAGVGLIVLVLIKKKGRK